MKAHERPFTKDRSLYRASLDASHFSRLFRASLGVFTLFSGRLADDDASRLGAAGVFPDLGFRV